MITRPMLAATIKNLSDIKYEILCSKKIDGIRIMKINDEIVTRKFKHLPNHFIRNELKAILPNGSDGEIIGTSKENFNATQSAVMSFDGQPIYHYLMFDYVKDSLNTPYKERMKDMVEWYENNKHTNVKLVLPFKIQNEEELLSFEQCCLAEGYEGVMIRKPDGPYKCNRSTVKEGYLMKLKRFQDSEAIIINFEEKLTNTNEKEKDEFGLSKRSSKKEGLVGANTLGSLIVRNEEGLEFGVGSGFDDELKSEIWANRDKWLGKTITYKHQLCGAKELPRFPVYKAVRMD